MKKVMDALAGDSKSAKLMKKAVALMLIVVFSLLFLNMMLNDSDGRNSIISEEGSNTHTSSEKTSDEIRLENILAAMAGVGDARVMIRSQDDGNESLFTEEDESINDVDGVIVVAEGAGNAVVRSEILEAVATVCNISPADVMVFEMSSDETAG